jgi:hypothetical protein
MQTLQLTTKETLAQASWCRLYPAIRRARCPTPKFLPMSFPSLSSRDCPLFSSQSKKSSFPTPRTTMRPHPSNDFPTSSQFGGPYCLLLWGWLRCATECCRLVIPEHTIQSSAYVTTAGGNHRHRPWTTHQTYHHPYCYVSCWTRNCSLTSHVCVTA